MTVLDEKNSSASNNFSDLSLQYIKDSSGWMKFCAIAGIIFSSLALLVTLIMLASMAQLSQLPGMAGFMFGITLFYGGFGSFYLYTSITLLQYATRLSNFVFNGDINILEEAFKKQKLYWILSGVFIIIMTVFIIIAFIAGMNAQSEMRYNRSF